MIEKEISPSRTIDDKLKTDERVRGNHAWNTCDGGVRGLAYSPERIKELVEKKHKKNYWKIWAFALGVITAISSSLLMFVYTNESSNKREGWFEIEKPFEEVDKKIEKYKGNIVEGLTLREVRENINSSLESFCERGYVGNGNGVFCDNGITPSLHKLLDVVGIVDKEKPNLSSVVLTFDERVIKYDESIQGKVIVVGGKNDYTLTDFSQHVLDNERNFVLWIGREYHIKIDYGKLKDLALVMAFPPLTPLIDKNALPETKFRLIYDDGTKRDIELDKKNDGCLTTGEMKAYCMTVDYKECEENYWKSFTQLEEMACRLQKKVSRDMNKHGDTGYELELVRWTTEKRDHVFTGKKTLTEQERIDKIHGLVDLLRTYIYNDILNLHDDIRMYDIKTSTNDSEIVAMMYELAHSYLDGVTVDEKDKETVSTIFKHIVEVVTYVRLSSVIKSDISFCSKLKNKDRLEELFVSIENIVKCLKGESSYEEEVINEAYRTLEVYADSPALRIVSGVLAKKACNPKKQDEKLDGVLKTAKALTLEEVKKTIDKYKDSPHLDNVVSAIGYIDDFSGNYKKIIDAAQAFGLDEIRKVLDAYPDVEKIFPAISLLSGYGGLNKAKEFAKFLLDDTIKELIYWNPQLPGIILPCIIANFEKGVEGVIDKCTVGKREKQQTQPKSSTQIINNNYYITPTTSTDSEDKEVQSCIEDAKQHNGSGFLFDSAVGKCLKEERIKNGKGDYND